MKSTELMSVNDLVAARLEEARKKQAKSKEKNKVKLEAADRFVSESSLVVSQDQAILRKEKSKWQKSKKMAEKQVAYIEEILEKTKLTLMFMATASKKILEELKYPQFSYANSM